MKLVFLLVMRMQAIKFISFLLLVLSTGVGFGQTIKIKGKVIDTLTFDRGYNLLIINQAKNKGSFGSYTGTFDFEIDKKDAFAISATGFKVERFDYSDSVGTSFDLIIYLKPLTFQSKTVTVAALKTLDELRQERAKLEKRETKTVTGIDALSSPITALYEAFSKRAKSKRLLAELEHKENQEEIVKELLRVYVHHKIIELDDNEFGKFVEFLNINEHFLKTASDYDLVVYIKDKFRHYMRMNDYYFED